MLPASGMGAWHGSYLRWLKGGFAGNSSSDVWRCVTRVCSRCGYSLKRVQPCQLLQPPHQVLAAQLQAQYAGNDSTWLYKQDLRLAVFAVLCRAGSAADAAGAQHAASVGPGAAAEGQRGALRSTAAAAGGAAAAG
jgi:hypothetical protein